MIKLMNSGKAMVALLNQLKPEFKERISNSWIMLRSFTFEIQFANTWKCLD